MKLFEKIISALRGGNTVTPLSSSRRTMFSGNYKPIRGSDSIQSTTNKELETNKTKKEELKKAIEEGLNHYGSPLASMSANFAEMPDSPIYDEYPYLIPAISILESSGGKNITYKNNPFNWAVYAQKEGKYQPSSIEQAIKDISTGIGGRRAEQGYTSEQLRTAANYEKFRKTGSLEDFANVYAPISDNPETGGNTYANNLRKVMSLFESKQKK